MQAIWQSGLLLILLVLISVGATAVPVQNPSFEDGYYDGTCERPSGWSFEDGSTGKVCIKSHSTDGSQGIGTNWVQNGFSDYAEISQSNVDLRGDTLKVDLYGPTNRWGSAPRSEHKVYVDGNMVKNCGQVDPGEQKTCSVDISRYGKSHSLTLSWEQVNNNCGDKHGYCDNLGNSIKDNIRIEGVPDPDPDQPINPSPSDGANNVALSPTLEVEAYHAGEPPVPVQNPSFEDGYYDGTCERPSGWSFEDGSTGKVCIKSHSTDGSQGIGTNWVQNGFSDYAEISQSNVDLRGDTLKVDLYGPTNRWGSAPRSEHKVYVDGNMVKNCGQVDPGEQKTCSVDISRYGKSHSLTLSWEQVNNNCGDKHGYCDNLGNSIKDNIRIEGAGDAVGTDGPVDIIFYANNGNQIGRNSNVDQGTTTRTTWSNRNWGQTYSWYAVATDGTTTSRSDTFSFETQDDTTPPTTTHDYSDDGWRSSSQTIDLSCSDGESGCQTTYYCIDKTNSCDPTSNERGTSPTINQDGTVFLRYQSVDNAGNMEGESSQRVRIDTLAPSVTIQTSPPEWSNGDQLIEASVSNRGPSTDRCSVSVSDNGDETEQNRDCLDVDVAVSVSGDCSTEGANTCSVRVEADDAAGNTGSAFVDFGIDLSAPTVTCEGGTCLPNNTMTDSSVSFTPTVDDTHAGLDNVLACEDENCEQIICSFTENEASCDFQTPSQPETVDVWVQMQDIVGNEATVRAGTFAALYPIGEFCEKDEACLSGECNDQTCQNTESPPEIVIS